MAAPGGAEAVPAFFAQKLDATPQKIGGSIPCLRKKNADRELFVRSDYTNGITKNENYSKGL